MKTFKDIAQNKTPPRTGGRTRRNRNCVSEVQYQETLNLVRNTLGEPDERLLLIRAGYSSTNPAISWRQDGKFPLIAVNALLGLLVGKQLAAPAADGREPLRVSTDDLHRIAVALSTCPDTKDTRQLQAGIYRELARRLEA